MKCLMKIIQTLINKVMKKGSSMEGFIREDGTIRPIEHYDDTELRSKIQTNTDNISNLDSRVTELEEHGGVEDPTKADKVENATAGNFASLNEEGNLQDSRKKPADFALAEHQHDSIGTVSSSSSSSGAVVWTEVDREGNPAINLRLVKRSLGNTIAKPAEITIDNIDNLNRALTTPSSTPENKANKLITSKAVYDALAVRAPYYDGEVIIKHLDDLVPYPFDGDNEVKNSVIALYNAIPKSTYVLCRVTLDNRDYSGAEDEIVTVPAFAYATEEQEDAWNVDIIFANGVKFSAGRQDTYAQYWTKTTNSFFS